MNPTEETARIETALPEEVKTRVIARTTLSSAATFWFIVTVIGQWIFALYVTLFYGSSAMQGDFENWNKVLPNGYTSGDTMGNLAVAMHLFLAVVIMVGGPLQLIPNLRKYARLFHRWNGRLYILIAFVISLTGLYMSWAPGRETVGDFMAGVSISINALLIMLCAAMALRYALIRDFRTHRHWTLRLFLVVNGVWFFRIGLMLWLFLNGGPVGFDPDTFQGPFLTFLGFAQYLLPLTILELYLHTQERGSVTGRFAMAACLLILTIATGIGVFAATMGMWLPRL